MPRRIDDIDLDPLVADAGYLRENRNTLFPFEVVGVHHTLLHVLVFSENARLLKDGVNEGGLAMIDMRDDADIADLGGHLNLSVPFRAYSPRTRSARMSATRSSTGSGGT